MSATDMNLGEMIAQCTMDSARWFPGAQNLAHLVLSLCGEAGELANIVKKVDRGSTTMEAALRGIGLKESIQYEVLDVLIYLCDIMGRPEFEGVDWQELWEQKRAHNESRFGKLPQRLPYQVLAEAGIVPEKRQTWQQGGDFAS